MFDELNPYGKHADFMMFYGDECDDPYDPVARRIAVMKKRNIAFGGGKGGRAPDPNPGMFAAADSARYIADKQAATADDMLEFYKDQYADIKPILEQVTQTQMDVMKANNQRAQEYSDYEKSTYRPLEQSIVKEANEFSTEGKREALATKAAADVNTAFANTRAQESRALSRMGVNPNSGRFAALNNQLSLTQAATSAGAMTKARDSAEQLGFARKMDAAGLGRNLATNASTAYGISVGAGDSAGKNSMAAGDFMGRGYSGAQAGYSQAANAYGTAGNIYGSAFNAQMQGYQADQAAAGGMASGIGSLVGTLGGAAMMMGSSEDYKKDKTPARGSALKGLRNLPIEEWTYKEGIEDEGRHIGTYAEDFKREFGKGDGKRIPIQDAIGVTMKSVQELAEKVDRLEGKKKTPLKRANGGAIHRGKGAVKGAGGPVDDKVPAMLSNGEYVLPADTTAKIGKKNLDKLVAQTHTPAAVQRKRKAMRGKK